MSDSTVQSPRGARPHLSARAEFYPGILWYFSSVLKVGESNIFRWCNSLMLGQEILSFGYLIHLRCAGRL